MSKQKSDEVSRLEVIASEPRPENAYSKGDIRTVETEFVAVDRIVNVDDHVTAIPTHRDVAKVVPQFQKTTLHYEVPRQVNVSRDLPIPVTHKQVIDEYVEVEYEAGTQNVYVPVTHVVEREVEVTRPHILWKTEERKALQVLEVVRYEETDDNVERVNRYIPDDPDFMKGIEIDEATPAMDFDSIPAPDAEFVRLQDKFKQVEGPMTIDVPIPYIVPNPVVVKMPVPVATFVTDFVPVPVKRHVTPKLTFTTEVYGVPCCRQKPIVIVEDEVVPVPVNVHLSIKEKDVTINPIDPSAISQADMHAMWMRVAADQLEMYKGEHDGKLPRGMRVPEELKVPARPTDWDVVLEAQAAADDESNSNEDNGELDLGPLPIDANHPLMMTWLQAQWMNTPTTETHMLYSPDFFRAHYTALNNKLDPTPHSVYLTPEQSEKLGPSAIDQLPHPWSSISVFKDAAETEALNRAGIFSAEAAA